MGTVMMVVAVLLMVEFLFSGCCGWMEHVLARDSHVQLGEKHVLRGLARDRAREGCRGSRDDGIGLELGGPERGLLDRAGDQRLRERCRTREPPPGLRLVLRANPREHVVKSLPEAATVSTVLRVAGDLDRDADEVAYVL